ncbi:hypothetical protein ACIA8E_41110 [Streptomyces sp. NPDC051664]|uniref:hypothetical protein n=1 Tax=Streptomyces sp. NPDC051664 TaxID=3365668 RepID=UPI0037905E69
MPELESMTRDELVVFARGQAVRLDELAVVIGRQDAQISAMATQLADVTNKFERQAQELAKLQHLHSRNSSKSSMPPSKDDTLGKVCRHVRSAGPSRAAAIRASRRARPGRRCAGAKTMRSTAAWTASPKERAAAGPTWSTRSTRVYRSTRSRW